MLELERLSKTYADGTHALADVTLEVRESEIVSLVGGSGCGKTTLLRLIAGVGRPSGGAILLDGERLSEPHPAVGIVFQEPRLLPWLTVADNVGFGLDDRSAAERRDRVGHALRRVGLIEHAGRWPRELSGGQQQRVAIARAIVMQPKPGRIFDEQALRLSRPRDKLSPAFEAATRRVLSTLDDSLKSI